MTHELRITYDDEQNTINIRPEHILSNRGLCYLMLGLAHEIVLRNGMNAPTLEEKPVEPANGRYGVQPVKIVQTPPKES